MFSVFDELPIKHVDKWDKHRNFNDQMQKAVRPDLFSLLNASQYYIP